MKKIEIEQQTKEDYFEQQNQKLNQDLLNYDIYRENLLNLSPKERAEKTAWRLFRLVYWSLQGQYPSEELKSEVLETAEKFFETHTRWSKPSIKIFKNLIGKSKIYENKERPFELNIRNYTWNLLERIESNELMSLKK